MKRDMDIIRELLLFIESNDSYNGSGYGPVKGEALGKPANIVLYHVSLLADAKLVSVVNWLANGDPLIRGLTWEGHEFLDTIRDPEIWKKTKDGTALAGGFTFELLKDLAKAFIKTKIEQQTGIKIA